MKIIYLANSRLPSEKAHGLQIAKMCEAFALAGQELDLWLPRRHNVIKDDLFSYYNVRQIFSYHKIFVIDTIKFFNNKIGFLIENFSFALAALVKMKKIRYHGVVYSRDYLSLAILSYFQKADLYYEIHAWPEQINFFYRRLFQKVRVVAISQGLAQELVALGVPASNILVAADGVDLTLFKTVTDDKKSLRQELALPPAKEIIAYIGKLTTMGQSKGVDTLMSVFADVLKKIPNSFLLLVGLNQEELGVSEKILTTLAISPDLYKLVPHVTSGQIIKYEKASDVLVMAYPDTKHYRLYMSPLKMFEYMAAQVPIVSTDLPAIREVLNERSACLVAATAASDLGAGIVKVLSDKNYASSLASQARSEVENFTWDKRAARILNFIKL